MLIFTGMAGACTSSEPDEAIANDPIITGVQGIPSVEVNVGSMRGPSSIGLVNFMETAETQPASLQNSYHFTVAGTADELVPQLANGSMDIALLPANLAATLYNKTEGAIQVFGINALGVLYVVSADESVVDMQSLAGRTVLIMGMGTTPDYVFNYLLEQNGLSGQVELDFKSEATEVAALLVADPEAIAVLPEPYVSSLSLQNPDITAAISLTEVWRENAERNGLNSELVTVVAVVRTEFALEHPEVIQEFIEQQTLSVKEANNNPAATAELIVKRGIIDNAQIAEQAITRSNVVCITGSDMRQALEGYLEVLYQFNPESVGGSMPEAAFYLK